MSLNGDVRSLLDALEQRGWEITRGSRHIRLHEPGSHITLSCPSTPGNPGAHVWFLQKLLSGKVPHESVERHRLTGNRPAFTCPHCRATSHHPVDVAQRYCGACHHFCDDYDLYLGAMGG